MREVLVYFLSQPLLTPSTYPVVVGMQDYDGGEIGQYFTQALNSTNGPADTMTWVVQSALDISNDTDNLIDLLVQEHAFVIVSSTPFSFFVQCSFRSRSA